MRDNCCKELGYKLSKSLLKSNDIRKSNFSSNENNINYLIYSQFKTCMELKMLGNKFNNCVKYEKTMMNK